MLSLVVLVTGIGSFVGGGAWAVPGGVQDPEGDAGGYKTDIRAVYHEDDPADGTVTYWVQTYDDFDNAGWVGGIEWDFNEDGELDGLIQYSLEWGPSYQVYNAQSTQAIEDNNEDVGRAEVDPKHNASGSTTSNTIKIVVKRSSMEKAGMGTDDDGYSYTAYLGLSDDPSRRDYTTGGEPKARHTFSTGAPATLTPATQVPGTGARDESSEPAGTSAGLIVGAALLVVAIGGAAYALARRARP